MYLYNISIIVEESQHNELLSWVKESWLTTLEAEVKLLKMLNTPHEGHTYCVQLVLQEESEIQEFQLKNLTVLQEHIAQQHNEKAFIFDSVMQYL